MAKSSFYTENIFCSHIGYCSQTTICHLKAELEKGPQEAAVYTQQIHQLQSNLDNLHQQSQVNTRMKYTNRLVMSSVFVAFSNTEQYANSKSTTIL